MFQVSTSSILTSKDDSFVNFTNSDIYQVINKLKVGKTPGADGIHNILIKNLPFDYVNKYLNRPINISAKEGLPNELKKAQITMIPKNGNSEDPSDYRPRYRQ